MRDKANSVQVRLEKVPIDIWQRASAHQEAIQREFDILRAELPEASPPNRLHALIEEYESRFGPGTEATRTDLVAAAKRGDKEVDVVFSVPFEAAEAARQLLRTFDEVDEFCRAGERLLTLATPPEEVAFRRWFLGEFSRQIEHGLEPRQWKPIDMDDGLVMDDSDVDPDDGISSPEPIRFEGDLDLASAGALRDQILDQRAAGNRSLTIDLTRVGFMDSVGISLLVSAHNRVVEDGMTMRLILPERLRPLIEMSGLLELLQPDFVELEHF
jgi:anti-anti-sigma factor